MTSLATYRLTLPRFVRRIDWFAVEFAVIVPTCCALWLWVLFA
jgi:hypothetical protein